MSNMVPLIFCMTFVAILYCISGIILWVKKAKSLIGWALFLITTGIFVATISGAYAHGQRPLQQLDKNSTYVFESKTIDPKGETIYTLYDLKNERNRLAFLEIYPPSGHREILANDGHKLLVPIIPGAKAGDCGAGPC